MSDCEITHEAEYDERQVRRLLDVLAHWSSLNKKPGQEKRGGERFAFEAELMVVVDLPAEDPNRPSLRITLRARSRNLSTAGVSIILPFRFRPKGMSDDAQTLTAREVFRPDRELLLGLPDGKGQRIWIRSQIAYARAVQDGYLKCGVRFLERVAAPAKSVG
jgi:hypothetical protein